MAEAQFYVVYDGPALEDSQMNINDLAPALLALGDLFKEANSVLNKSEMAVQLKVRASFRTGSFGIDLIAVQTTLQSLLSIFNSDAVNGALNLIEILGLAGGTGMGLLQVIKWIRGRNVTQVTIHDDDKATIMIDDDELKVEQKIIDLLQNHKIRQALQQAIAEPLEKEGIEIFACAQTPDDKTKFEIISKTEGRYFKSPPVEDEHLDEKEYEASYELISPVFQEDNKWRMSDGDSKFYVEILDHDFIREVQRSERNFAKGDILRMKVRETQVLTENGLKSTRQALEILEHRNRVRQLPLPIING